MLVDSLVWSLRVLVKAVDLAVRGLDGDYYAPSD